MARLGEGKRIALFMAASVSLITAGALVIGYFLINKSFGLVTAGVCAAVFIFVYLFAYRSIREFITNRIAPVYQMIADRTVTRKEIKDRLKAGDISEVSDDVAMWTMQRSNEIRQLYETERYRKEFLGNVSHELKTPLFNIQGYVLTLLEGGLDDPSINRLYLEHAEKNITRLVNIVEDLNVITRLENGELKLDIEKFDLVKLIAEAFESVELKANQRNIKLQMPASQLPVVVLADRKRIFQLLVNLLVNSINYGKEGGTTQITLSEAPNRVLVNVADNGIGIEQKDMQRIFERFYRVDKHRSRDAGGSGLGLAIVKHIVEAHNQTIVVRSTVNEGSTFVFTLKKA